MRTSQRFATLNAEGTGGAYGELEKAVQALDIGAGTGVL